MMMRDGEDEQQRRQQIDRTWAAVWRCQYRVQHGDRSVLATLGRHAARLRALTGEDVHMETLFDLLQNGPESEPPPMAMLAAVDALLDETTPAQPRSRWLTVR